MNTSCVEENDIIESFKLHIINEVKKYAARKRLFSKLSKINIYNEEIIQNKTEDELVDIYKKSIDCLHDLSSEINCIGEYIRFIVKTIKARIERDESLQKIKPV